MTVVEAAGRELSELFPRIEPHRVRWGFRTENGTGAIAAGPDTFDSEMLQMRIARVHAAQAASRSEFCALYRGLAMQLRHDGFEQVLRRVPARDFSEIWALEQTGFNLLDIGVTFARRLEGPLVASEYDDLTVRSATAEDVERFASTMCCECWKSRYDAAPAYRPENVSKLRAQWLRNSLQGRAAVFLVGDVESQPAGYVVGLLDRAEGIGEVDLVATLPEFRGRRVAARILDHVVAWFSQKARLLTVRTQATNIAATNLYEKAGFLLYESDLTYRQNLADLSGEPR